MEGTRNACYEVWGKGGFGETIFVYMPASLLPGNEDWLIRGLPEPRKLYMYTFRLGGMDTSRLQGL
jgi:hypothetical protein